MNNETKEREDVEKLSTSNVPKEYHDVLIRARKWVFHPCGNSFMHPQACKIMVEMHDIITGLFSTEQARASLPVKPDPKDAVIEKLKETIDCAARYLRSCGYDAKRKQGNGFQEPEDAILADFEQAIAAAEALTTKEQ